MARAQSPRRRKPRTALRRDPSLLAQGLKECLGPCGRALPLDDFYKQKNGYGGRLPDCKECESAAAKAKRSRNNTPRIDDNSALRPCSKCKVPQPRTAFGASPSARDGLTSWCRGCKGDLNRKRAQAVGMSERRRRDPSLLARGLKECFGLCARTLPLDDFAPVARGYGGRAYSCRECVRVVNKTSAKRRALTEYAREWRKDNPRHKERHRINQHERKTRQKVVDTGLVTPAVAKRLYEKTCCAYCERETPARERTMDHVVPLARGGVHDPSNLVMACHGCNSRKRDTAVEVFLADRPDVLARILAHSRHLTP